MSQILTKKAKKLQKESKALQQYSPYERFGQINGEHDFRDSVPNGYVDYQARLRPGGKVTYFNFSLAKEMGLIPSHHPHALNPSLSQVLLETFGLIIINEYDIKHKKQFKKTSLKKNSYMATRYLQLQHPSRQGRTSGDGRGIWNGKFTAKGTTWDISSSGTGATRLSPATAQEKKYFRSGDPRVCYGCGYNEVPDGLYSTVMSEVFHKNGIPTERSLAIIEYPKGFSVNVRAGKCLLRPSHFFCHLKQGNYTSLKGAMDYLYERNVQNGKWKKISQEKKRYPYMLRQIAIDFARAAALFESEYIFCWMDWDGDNILTDGGIIDYGSVRQFGLYHHEYRYDDVDRFSTTIPEQKQKARYIIQNFAQITDFIIRKKKRRISVFRKHPILRIFDQEFQKELDRLLLRKIGLRSKWVSEILEHNKKELKEFKKQFSYFEKAKSIRGVYEVSDGITCDAVFCMRDLLRELPQEYLKGKDSLNPNEFTQIVRSSYAKTADLRLTPYRIQKIRKFQKHYKKLISWVSKKEKIPFKKVLLEVCMRSSIINRYDRITGDGILTVTEELLKKRKSFSPQDFHHAIEEFVKTQDLRPHQKTKTSKKSKSNPKSEVKKLTQRLKKIIGEYRDGF